MNDETLNKMRDIIQEDVGRRGLRTDPVDNLITACPDDFRLACHSLADAAQPSLAIVTGFFIPTASPPSGETDGPLGALFLARALVPLGIHVVLVTDAFCATALQVGLEACGLAKQVALITLPSYAESQQLGHEAYWQRFLGEAGPITHLLALERVGPSHAESRCFSMRGRDITELMSPAHWLLEAAVPAQPRIVTLGIGDGGNEIGMGKIARDVIARNIPRGELVACRVPADHLIVCGISNWGAYGLAAGVRYLRGAAVDEILFDVSRELDLLEMMVRHGPLVDGVTGLQAATVDGLDFATYAEVLRRLATCLGCSGATLS